MIYDLQKGSLLKRASAFLLDAILLAILAVGFALILSSIFGYNKYNNIYADGLERYSKQYNVDFEKIISQADYDALSEQERANYEAAIDALNNDFEVLNAMNVLIRMIVAIASVSIFLSFMVLEFILPMVFKNGQTVGKKIFGLAVMKKNGVRVRAISLFARTFLGKYVIETMIPVLIVIVTIFNAMGIMPGPGLMGFGLVLVLFFVNGGMLFFSKTNSMLHDAVADTVVVDMASQMIFEDEKSMVEYKAKKAAEEAAASRD